MKDGSFSYFLLGFGLGTALGLLFAPKPGEEMRRDLGARTEEGRDYLRRRREELREQADDILDRGRSVVQSQRERVVSALEAGRQAYREEIESHPGPAPAES